MSYIRQSIFALARFPRLGTFAPRSSIPYIQAQKRYTQTMPDQKPSKIGVLLFPGFQLLDICGPLDVLNILSRSAPLSISILASTLDPVSTETQTAIDVGSKFSQAIVPTHTFADAPGDLEVLIIPGGFGCRKEENIAPLVEFVKRYAEYGKEGEGKSLKYTLTVCTGSAILAKSGLLDGRKATSNKKSFAWVRILPNPIPIPILIPIPIPLHRLSSPIPHQS